MNLGLVFAQGDFVLISVFLLLILMSIITWSVIIIRSVILIRAKKSNKAALDAVWSASNLTQAEEALKAHNAPISELANVALEAKRVHKEGQGQLIGALPLDDYLTRQMRNCMTQILRQFDSGLTTLASIGATAPFIGLFGTVWGIYHALINISSSGQMSIAAVSGPIGEALVATAAGLFVAIPAVLAYNALVRGNKTLSQDLDGFAHDFHTQILNTKE